MEGTTDPAGLNQSKLTPLERLRVFVLVGFGSGWAPVAPGTFGTLPAIVLSIPMLVAFDGLGLVLAFAVAALVSTLFGLMQTGLIRKAFGSEDPGSVVLDEIAGMFTTLAVSAALAGRPSHLALAVGFGFFRLFDILKPGPVRRFERLPGARGVMADDVVAGGFAGLLLALCQRTLEV